MGSITINEKEFLHLKQNIQDLQEQLQALKAVVSTLKKEKKTASKSKTEKLPLKFGAGKNLVSFIADDFDEPLSNQPAYR